MLKLERLSKQELIEYCQSIGIETNKKSKVILLSEAKEYKKIEIKNAVKSGNSSELLRKKIELLAKSYANNLKTKINARKEEMKSDDNSHYLIYQVLGISDDEGKLIDQYQNTGRFLYKYAGSFLEEATMLCLQFKNIDGGKFRIKNNQGQRPKTFEIDFLDGKNAIEIKWRDATTDGDHITKEHTRIKAIESYGYIPIRIMFYYPQRTQAKRIQETLKTVYAGLNGEYYAGREAWDFIKKYTNYDLKAILEQIAKKK